MFNRRTRVHYALFAFLLLPVIARAQSTFGDIRGTTRDPQGLALPNATVTLHDTGENTTRSTIGDDRGDFLFENLKPGTYAMTATKVGFSGSPTVTIELDARQSARVDLALSVGSVLESVSVAATSQQIDTEDATVDDTKGTGQLVEMPLNFRAQTTSPLSPIARATSGWEARPIP